MTSFGKIALFAGAGQLPWLVIKQLSKDKQDFIIIIIDDLFNIKLLNQDIRVFNLKIGQIGSALRVLNQEKIQTIIFAGGVKRPSFRSIKLDIEGIKLLTKIIKYHLIGDNQLLLVIIKFFEQKGFKVIGAHQLNLELTLKAGQFSKLLPSAKESKDIEIAISLLMAISPFDVGQALIIENGLVLGIEAAEGTKQLINRSKNLKKETTRVGILVKMAKNQQEQRIDLPTIGPETVISVHQANLAGIAIEAEKTIVIDQQMVIELCNQLGIFLVAFKL